MSTSTPVGARKWTVDIFIDEHEGSTHAEARLHTGDPTHLTGSGSARLNPHDRDVPEIGDELAAARALSDLTHQLLLAASDDIAGITHERVDLDS